MFTKELSIQMLKVIDERKLTLETLSEAAGLSRKFVGNIINGKQVPTLDSFEKICSALQLEPNDLLLSKKSKEPDRAEPMRVNMLYCDSIIDRQAYTPICPNCNSLLSIERQSHCDICGQRLSWYRYTESNITFERPKRL